MKKTLAIIVGIVFMLPAFATAQGLIGECADCHTMHNSEQGAEVAQVGIAGTLSETPNANLLRMDCIACHAQDTDQSVVTMGAGSQVPQVYHTDTVDLAGGNFRSIIEAGNDELAGRRGHNITALGINSQTDNPTNKAGASGVSIYAVPPGQYYGYQDGHGKHLSTARANGFDKFTCAGAGGCHGTRSQFLATAEYVCLAADIVVGGVCEGLNAGDILATAGVPRSGMAAISGAHHNNYDGVKEPDPVTAAEHDGAYVASSYRFLNGVYGFGNQTAGDRWENASAASHNEYFGAQAAATTDAAGCNSCHVPGADPGLTYDLNGAPESTSSRMALNSTLQPPNQSMSGFCTTCHGNFHSSSLEDGTNYDRGPYNGTSGAFLRHPSDYVIPNEGEYAALFINGYNITAPVARDSVNGLTASSSAVTQGDMVMCLSCHKAHASDFEGMLRFDYNLQVAGNTLAANANEGCAACHTTKGVSKQP